MLGVSSREIGKTGGFDMFNKKKMCITKNERTNDYKLLKPGGLAVWRHNQKKQKHPP